jgi:hypothetical protein
MKLRNTKWIFFHLTVISLSTISVDQFLLVSLSSLLSICKLLFAFVSMRAFIICYIGVDQRGQQVGHFVTVGILQVPFGKPARWYDS